MQTLRDVKEQAERDQARFKRRGHKGLTAEDLRVLAAMDVAITKIIAERGIRPSKSLSPPLEDRKPPASDR
jgi:hypothetical protein